MYSTELKNKLKEIYNHPFFSQNLNERKNFIYQELLTSNAAISGDYEIEPNGKEHLALVDIIYNFNIKFPKATDPYVTQLDILFEDLLHEIQPKSGLGFGR